MVFLTATRTAAADAGRLRPAARRDLAPAVAVRWRRSRPVAWVSPSPCRLDDSWSATASSCGSSGRRATTAPADGPASATGCRSPATIPGAWVWARCASCWPTGARRSTARHCSSGRTTSSSASMSRRARPGCCSSSCCWRVAVRRAVRGRPRGIDPVQRALVAGDRRRSRGRGAACRTCSTRSTTRRCCSCSSRWPTSRRSRADAAGHASRGAGSRPVESSPRSEQGAAG